MAGHETSLVKPKTGLTTLKIPAGSPLAIQGIFIEILRERFSSDAGVPWTWKNSPETDILIEASFSEGSEMRNYSPAIFVNRLQTTPGKVMVGDRAGVRLPDHFEGFGALMTVGLSIDSTSNDEGESAMIGDIVQFMLLASEDVIQREFGIYDMTHPSLSATQPFEQDQSKFNTTVTFQVQFWVRWSQVPIGPLIQQIAQRVESSGEDATTHFTQITVDSLSKTGSSK